MTLDQEIRAMGERALAASRKLAAFSSRRKNAVLEAMAAGLPIVASATGGIPEMLQADAAGRSRCGFALPNEVDEIADVFSLLAADAGLREKMGEAARQTWAERYSAEIMAAAYENLYRKLLFG